MSKQSTMTTSKLEKPDSNGARKLSIVSVAFVGAVGLTGIIAISLVNPGQAAILATSVGTMVTSVIGFIIIIASQKRQETRTEQIVHHTNSIFDAMLKLATQRGHAAGVAEERERINEK